MRGITYMERKSLIKNYLFNASYQLLAIIVPLVTTPYVSRILNPAGVGVFNYIYAIAYVFSLICLLGTNIYGQREIAYVQDNPKKQSQVFWEIISIKIIAFALTSLFYLCILFVLDDYFSYLIAAYSYILASLFDISWLFQGLEDFKKTVIRNSAVKVIGVILIFFIVKKSDDISKYILILGGSSLVGQICMWAYIPRSFFKCNIKELNIRRHIEPTIILLLPSIATYIYTSLDKVMLGTMSTQMEVGYYSQAEKIVKLIMTIVTSLGIVLIPRMSSLIKQQEWNQVKIYFEKSVKFVLLLSLPMVAGIDCIAKEFIPLFLGIGYEKSILLLKIMSPLILIIGIASITGQAVLVSMNKQTYYVVTVISGSIINCLLNIILIPKINSYGAAIATIAAESVVTVLQLAGVRKFIDMRKIVSDNYKSFICTGGMLIVLRIINLFCSDLPAVYLIMSKVCFGIVAYLGFLLILKVKI